MSAFRLDTDFDNKLIELVRANPCLYEKELRNSPYLDMKKKFDLWQNIAASLNSNAKYCILRWKNLRGKFRRESTKMAHELTWELFDKMKFLEKHIKYHVAQRNIKTLEHQIVPIDYENMDAEQLVEEVYDDDPLQEAMDDQPCLVAVPKEKNVTVTVEVNPTPTTLQSHSGTMKRIEALLEGIGETNRLKAEKRIVGYLCRCQLKALNNDDIDDLSI